MTIDEIVAKIPEADREPIKAELGAYVKVGSREDAERLAREHPHFKATVDSFISKAVQSHDERFQAEKVPALVEAELAKRNPPKDPRDAKLAEMEKRLADMQMETVREKQTALAVAKAAEKGIPVELAKKYIGNSDDETIANIESLAGPLTAWRDEYAKKAMVERLGNNGAPKGGNASPDALAQMKKRYVELNNAGRTVEATALWLKINEEERKLNG